MCLVVKQVQGSLEQEEQRKEQMKKRRRSPGIEHVPNCVEHGGLVTISNNSLPVWEALLSFQIFS